MINDFDNKYYELNSNLDSLTYWIDQEVEEIVYSDDFNLIEERDGSYMSDLTWDGSFKFVEGSEFYDCFNMKNWEQGREARVKLYDQADFYKNSFKDLDYSRKYIISLIDKKRSFKVHDRQDIDFIDRNYDYVQEKYHGILSRFIKIIASKVKFR